MIAAARWRKCPRESDASLFILVQVQAGPPRFALTGYAWRSHAETVRAKRVRRSWSEAEAKTDWASEALTRKNQPKIPVDGAFLGVSRVRNLV